MMNDNNVNAGFLPGTPFSQGEKEYPPFQHYINQNWKWTIATDFNPNCQTLSLPFIGSLLFSEITYTLLRHSQHVPCMLQIYPRIHQVKIMEG